MINKNLYKKALLDLVFLGTLILVYSHSQKSAQGLSLFSWSILYFALKYGFIMAFIVIVFQIARARYDIR